MGKGMASELTLTLYKSDDSISKELHRRILPWGLLKRGIQLTRKFKNIDVENMTEEDADLLSDYILLIFEGQCTREELEKGADIPMMLVLLQNILARAQQAANPTLPATKRRPK